MVGQGQGLVCGILAPGHHSLRNVGAALIITPMLYGPLITDHTRPHWSYWVR